MRLIGVQKLGFRGTQAARGPHRRPSQSRCDSQLPEQEARCASGTSSGGERPLDVTLSTLENALLNDEKLCLGLACAPVP